MVFSVKRKEYKCSLTIVLFDSGLVFFKTIVFFFLFSQNKLGDNETIIFSFTSSNSFTHRSKEAKPI